MKGPLRSSTPHRCPQVDATEASIAHLLLADTPRKSPAMSTTPNSTSSPRRLSHLSKARQAKHPFFCLSMMDRAVKMATTHCALPHLNFLRLPKRVRVGWTLLKGETEFSQTIGRNRVKNQRHPWPLESPRALTLLQPPMQPLLLPWLPASTPTSLLQHLPRQLLASPRVSSLAGEVDERRARMVGKG